TVRGNSFVRRYNARSYGVRTSFGKVTVTVTVTVTVRSIRLAASMHLADLDATAQAELVRSGQASPRELVDAAIVRIERDNAELGAFIMPRFEQAREEADLAPHGPF